MSLSNEPAPREKLAWRTFEIGFWVVATLVNTAANSFTSWYDIERLGRGVEAWKPVVWETSSGLLLLALLPLLVWFTRRNPLHWDTWRRALPLHLAASIVFCLAHVVGMVLLRKLAYASQGQSYDFGHWPSELIYEYFKDIRTYVLVVAIIEAYRFIRRRMQGEARLLDLPDEGPPLEPVERPKRFLVRKLGREFLIAAADVEWLQAAGNYVNLRVRGHDYPLRSTIAGIEARLDPARFHRIHRSYIVNLDQIASIEPLESGDARVRLKDHSILPCSRRYREVLRERLAAD